MVPRKITLIADSGVLRIPIKENNEPLVDLASSRQIAVYNSKSKESNRFSMIRKHVAAKLIEASEHLPKGIRFLVYEAYRPLRLQRKYFTEYYKELSKIHPDWDKVRLAEETSKFIAPPESVPPHSTGGAIDLTLVDNKGHKLDMGTKYDATPEESKDACFTLSHGISKEAKGNRQLLIDALSKVGFVNYPTEWWHWSYGDRYWAFQTKNPHAIYGGLDL